MGYKLVKITKLSGYEASIYSIYLHDEQKTLFDRFLEENINSFNSELNNIYTRLKIIGHETGARKQFFRTDEGTPGDGVCALSDVPKSNLRLYCIRYGALIVILGGGGFKSKNIRALQEDEKLTDENYLMRKISRDIQQRMKDKELTFTDDYKDFEGDFNFNDEDDE